MEAPQVAQAHKGWPHGKLEQKSCASFDVDLRYRSRTSDADMHEVRWYMIGALHIAYMQIFTKETHANGNYCVFINSIQGNGGSWFKSEKEAHTFIQSELQRIPTP